MRGKKVVTAVPADLADRPEDLVERGFQAERPDQLWVANLTYVRTRRSLPRLGRDTAAAGADDPARAQVERSCSWLDPGERRVDL